MYRWLVLTASAVVLAACATQYTQEGLGGGFVVKDLGQDVYRVSFRGNGYTSRETVLVYWLYRNAELALEKGYSGFEILYSGSGVVPSMSGDVHFIRRPVESAPPKLFNAKTLKARLEPIVAAEKCEFGNVCPHVHDYILPKGKLQNGGTDKPDGGRV
jgi:hypothetical protein